MPPAVASTAKQVVVVGQLTALRSFKAPNGAKTRHVVAPPSVVPAITPVLPAAKHVVVLGQLTPLRGVAVAEDCCFHVDPSLVARVLPEFPTV
jgi:hypothetical protein